MTEEAGPAEAALEAPTDGELREPGRWRSRMTVAGGVAVLLVAAIVLPPLISVGRYQRQITALMTRAMGRPVRLSSVELRLLPRPGFVLHDLSVGEDPVFGAEPILSARTVVASVAILSLWKGKPQIDRVSVDEASLNLVRNAQGRWNLESLMMGAEPRFAGSGGASSDSASAIRPISAAFPYLEATNSRVNLKNGVEKSPFSIVETDLSLWQDEPGAWRVRLRGQPVRTDIQMSLGDTGQVQLEASLRTNAGPRGQLRDMPLKLQMEWRDAQLGQLSRLLTGSDAGWRGQVTADIDVLGSPESAQTKARLRATEVRREEFAPDTPLDFDANCNFRYQHSLNAFHQLTCDTAIGDGRLHLKADLPGGAGKPEAMLEVKQVPLQAALDLLRTVRSGFAPGISMTGFANGSLTYKLASPPEPRVRAKTARARHFAAGKLATSEIAKSAANTLTGSIAIDQAVLNGGGLKEQLVLPPFTFTPIAVARTTGSGGADSAAGLALGTRFTIALASATPAPPATPRAKPHRADSAVAAAASSDIAKPSKPGSLDTTQADIPEPVATQSAEVKSEINVKLGFGASGFDTNFSGMAGMARLRDLAYALGIPHNHAIDGLTAASAEFELVAAGPWIPPATRAIPTAAPAIPGASSGSDSFSGSLALHRSQWRAPYLARPVDLTQTTVTLTPGKVTVTAEFSVVTDNAETADAGTSREAGRNAVKGALVVTAVSDCGVSECRPQVQLRFSALDAAAMEAAFLAPPEQKTLLSPIIDEVERIRSSGTAKWPDAAVTAQADSLTLGAATFRKVTIQMRLTANEVVVQSWHCEGLGGAADGVGHFGWVADKPEYSLEGKFSGLNPGLVGGLLAGIAPSRWSGGPLTGSGKVTLSGLNSKELAASAAGELHFTWSHGTIGVLSPGVLSPGASSPPPARFDLWSGDATIQHEKIELGQNTLVAGRRSSSLAGVVPFGAPPKISVNRPAH